MGNATLTVTPDTCLNGNDKVSVSGVGLKPDSPGSVIECNGAPNQPTISVAGNPVPISCTNPLKTLVTTSASGDITFTFTIVTGFAGPPAPGLDSAGHDAATDAGGYPCPPTTAQAAAGGSCVIAFGDLAGDQLSVPIAFVANVQPTQTSPATASATPSGSSGSPDSSSSPSGSLAFTGIRTKLMWQLLSLGVALVYLGLLAVVVATTPPRRRRA